MQIPGFAIPTVDTVFHAVGDGLILLLFGYARRIKRTIEVQKDFPPHFHDNGNIVYPRDFPPPKIARQHRESD